MKCRQNWSTKCEDALNQQIKVEYQASYHYHLLASYFYRDDIGLNKLGNYFNEASLEEREHADKLMRYQTKRGGIVKLNAIPVPSLELQKKTHVRDAFELALTLEKSVNEQLLKLHGIASEENDPQFSDYLEGDFLEEQVDAISDLSKKISQLELIGEDGHGIWEFVNSLEESK
jgi:ferritin heavy chain